MTILELLKDPMFWIIILKEFFKLMIFISLLYFVFWFGYTDGKLDTQKEFAMKTNCAQYDKKTGKFKLIQKENKCLNQ